MKHSYLIALACCVLAAGCALQKPELRGEELVSESDLPKSIERINQAIRAKPDVVEYRAILASTVERHVSQTIAQGQEALRVNDPDRAESVFREALRYHAENAPAQTGLKRVADMRAHKSLIANAKAAMEKDDLESARNVVRSVLVKDPKHAEATLLLAEIDTRIGKKQPVEFPELAKSMRRPVTLNFKDVPIKNLLDAISQQSGLSFIFDRDVNMSQPATLITQGSSLSDALNMLLASAQLSKKVLNPTTLIVYPNTPAKQRDYQDTVVKSFFLSNAAAKDVMNLIRGMAKIRDIYIDERLNMIVVRDTAEAVALAERLVAMTDRAEAEVMLQVEIMEINGSKLQELGLLFPTQFGVLNIQSSTTTGSVTTTTSTPLTVNDLRNINSSSIGVTPNPAVNLLRTDGNLNVLANPRIRVKNKEKARIHIGDKLPVITSNVTSTGVTSESVTYLDVGLKFDVEPLVKLEGDVEMRVALEVSNIAGTVKTSNGTLAYQLGSRNASTVLRLKDGETQVLAGLISDSERASANKLPGLGQLPVIGRLFSNTREEASKSEIVLLITPRIVRNIERPDLAEGEFFAGTESRTSDQPLLMRPTLNFNIEGASEQPAVAPTPAPAPPVIPAPQPSPSSSAPGTRPPIFTIPALPPQPSR